MKRIRIVLILAIAALLACTAACKPAEPSVTEPTVTEAPAATAEPTLEPTPEPTAEPTSEPTLEPTPEPKVFQHGVWTDNVYENEFLNLRFTLPEGFVAASDAEMAAMMEIEEVVPENGNATELQEQAAAQSTIYDLMVTNPQTNSMVMVILENLALSIGGEVLTPETYADLFAAEVTGTDVDGYKYTVEETYSVDLAGESYYVLPTVLGDGLYYQDYYLRKTDGYMVTICIAYAGGSEADAASIKDAFTAIDA